MIRVYHCIMLFPSNLGICPGEHIFLWFAGRAPRFHHQSTTHCSLSHAAALKFSLFIAFSCARSLPSPAEPFSEKKNTNPTQTTTEHLPSAFLRLLKNSELVTFSVGMNKRSPDIADLCPKFTCNQMAFCKLVEKCSDSVFSQYFALEHASALPGFGQDQKWKCWNTMRQTVRLRFPTHFSRPKQSKAVLINSWNFWIPSWTEPLYFSFWVAQRCPFLLMGCWSSLKAQISLSPAQSHTQAYPKKPPSAQLPANSI